MIDHGIRILGRRDIDEHRRGRHFTRQFTFDAGLEHRGHGIVIRGIVREPGVRIGIRHAFNFRRRLGRELRNGIKIQVVGLGAGNLHPTQESFRIPGFDRYAAGRRSLTRHLTG